ncbi:MAG: formyltetrahydrofolate deformylase [Leptospiraceae bacterium]|nr:formyltetrahydrofolate deformylase [Leptospiraceae bacterium]
MKSQNAILLVSCPDQKGLVTTITEFIFKNGGNIIDLDQHTDLAQQVFFMRVAWELKEFSIPKEKIGEFFKVLIADRFQMKWKLYFSGEIPKMAIFVSKYSHCLYELLSKWQSGEWKVDIPLIISNHETTKPIAQQYGIPYYYLPVTPETKIDKEKEVLEILKKFKIDFIVLARYMQILSQNFIAHYPNKIINIHHSFLPAFPGAKPYEKAYERGVKIIGATSHYAADELDAGPIIEQDVVRVSHKNDIEDLKRIGRDFEKIVLSRAVWLHLQRKILVHQNRTIVFNYS